MWHTPLGIRTLTGPEAKLIREALAVMVDEIHRQQQEEDEEWEDSLGFEVPLFDRLSVPQKYAILAEVAGALLKDEIPPPKLSAIREATVAAIYTTVRHHVHFEIDSESDQLDEPCDRARWWRILVLAATKASEISAQRSPDDDYSFPETSSTDKSEWELLIACLEDRVLWDDDWAMEELIVDALPEVASLTKYQFGITDDYYTDIAPEPSPTELVAIQETLKELIQQ